MKITFKCNYYQRLFKSPQETAKSAFEMSTPRVAVVSGANRGIGYAIVKGLCEKFDGIVYLTARDVGRGLAAVKKLNSLGFNPEFHQMDINDEVSITKLRDHLSAKYGGFDLLVNNAAIAYKVCDSVPFDIQAEKTNETNYYGSLKVCQILFPILKPNAKVVNVSSVAGHLSQIKSQSMRDRFNDPKLTVPQLNRMVEDFVQETKSGRYKEEIWGDSAYGVSKVSLSALTKIQQREFDNEPQKRNIVVNSVHPGYVATEMTGFLGHWTIEQGATAPLFLALHADDWKAEYVWSDAVAVPWDNEEPPGPY